MVPLVPLAPDPLTGLQVTSELTTEAPEALQVRDMDLTPISTTSTVKSGHLYRDLYILTFLFP